MESITPPPSSPQRAAVAASIDSSTGSTPLAAGVYREAATGTAVEKDVFNGELTVTVPQEMPYIKETVSRYGTFVFEGSTLSHC